MKGTIVISIISFEKAKQIALDQTGGAIMDVKLCENEDQYVYKAISEKKSSRIHMTIDATTGDILEVEKFGKQEIQ